MKQPLGIYVHIPFCVKKCAYCDFLSGPNTIRKQAEYIEALQKEIRCYKDLADKYEVVSVFFGGGTPSSLEGEQLMLVLQTIYQTFGIGSTSDIEITVECNPGTLTVDKLRAYHENGVNRLSIGLQSANNRELKLLGRIHTYEEFLESYQLVQEAGFTNVNIDLMSALPGQTMESYENTLHKVLALNPSHISAYSLIVEEGTPFYEQYGEGKPHEDELPNEELDRAMYVRTKELLKEYGYERYEISNYAKPGFACRHNSLYWTGVDYIGFGLGASSCLKPKRYANDSNMETYLTTLLNQNDSFIIKRALKCECIALTKENLMEEYMFLGLRMIQGVNLDQFRDEFGVAAEEVYGEVIRMHKGKGLLREYIEGENRYLALTEKGLDISNYVMADFMLE